MKNLKIVVSVMLCFGLLFTSCETMQLDKSAVMGGVTGTAAGGAVGAGVGSIAGNTGVGAAIGAVVGGTAGVIIPNAEFGEQIFTECISTLHRWQGRWQATTGGSIP